jgi:hypothetical protein
MPNRVDGERNRRQVAGQYWTRLACRIEYASGEISHFDFRCFRKLELTVELSIVDLCQRHQSIRPTIGTHIDSELRTRLTGHPCRQLLQIPLRLRSCFILSGHFKSISIGALEVRNGQEASHTLGLSTQHCLQSALFPDTPSQA